MRASLLLVLLLAGSVFAQAPAPAAPPTATPNICDATYSVQVETADHNDVSSAAVTVRAMPWADVASNHDKQMKILDALSKAQNKGGPYTITVAETNTCDGGATVRVPTGSVFVEGVMLSDSVKVTDVALQMGKEINDRYRNRANAGAQVGWNHKNAKKVKRNDLGQVVPDTQ